MNRERLLAAARAVREGKPEHFTMDVYAQPCGTPACVLGHYAARGDLQQEFRLAQHENWLLPRLILQSSGDRIFFDSLEVMEHFGIEMHEAYELLAEDGCGNAKTNEEAARYIEAFVARKEAGQ